MFMYLVYDFSILNIYYQFYYTYFDCILISLYRYSFIFSIIHIVHIAVCHLYIKEMFSFLIIIILYCMVIIFSLKLYILRTGLFCGFWLNRLGHLI